jgi:hypothetical protein
MARRFHNLHALGVALVTILVAPFVLFLALLTVPALLLFAPFLALFEAGEATAHELERREDKREVGGTGHAPAHSG